MSLAKKIDHIMDEIYSLDEKGMDELARRIKEIKKLIKKINGEEEKLFYDMVNESLKDVWDNEKDRHTMTYNKGDVVLIPFPFTNASANKRRPALVISNLDTGEQADVMNMFNSIIK